jgi:phenylacetaldehyde dehydrogenase
VIEMNMPVTLQRLGPDAAKFVAKEKKLFIGGKWTEAASGKTFEVVDPATGQVFDHVPLGDKADMDLAVAAARRAFEDGPWASITPADRGKLVWRLGDLVEKHADEIAQIEALDNGKPVNDARFGDVAFSYELLRYMAGWSTKITGQTIPVSSAVPFHSYTLREPVGVCGQIVPWNFSFMMAVWKLAPALAAGCTVVLKPAEQTPLTALRLAELVEEAGFPEGVFNVVTGFGETAGAALAGHPDVDKVAFTGSTEVGRKIMSAAQGNLKKISLELGGKSPMIVFSDADLEKAIPAITMGMFYNMGQTCTAGTRLYIHADISDTVVDGVAKLAAKMPIGPGLDPKSQIGPLVSDEQFQRVRRYIEAGVKEGAELRAGGNRVGDAGYFLEPTILTRTRPDMSVVREEIFGPVLCAASFDDAGIEAVVREANNSIYGLAASVFTRNVSTAHKVSKKLRAGIIGVNTHHAVDPALPFGGVKQSGWGRENGYEAIQQYTEVKSVSIAL